MLQYRPIGNQNSSIVKAVGKLAGLFMVCLFKNLVLITVEIAILEQSLCINLGVHMPELNRGCSPRICIGFSLHAMKPAAAPSLHLPREE